MKRLAEKSRAARGGHPCFFAAPALAGHSVIAATGRYGKPNVRTKKTAIWSRVTGLDGQ